MRNGVVQALNGELEGLTDPKDRLEHYKAMVDLYAEYVGPKEKVSHRRNTRQVFPTEPRTKFGRAIKTSNVSNFQ